MEHVCSDGVIWDKYSDGVIWDKYSDGVIWSMCVVMV